MRQKLMESLEDMDRVAQLFETVDFDVYFLGGVACVLGNYTDRATRDFDFIDLGYNAKMGRIFAMLKDFDMLDYSNTLLAPDYKVRAKKLDNIKNFNAYILGAEDIVVSKIIRLEEKDWEDIERLMITCNKEVLRAVIASVSDREDLFPQKKAIFLQKLGIFREKYDV